LVSCITAIAVGVITAWAESLDSEGCCGVIGIIVVVVGTIVKSAAWAVM
jgi:hypothetical protein